MARAKKDKRTMHQKEVDRIYTQLSEVEDTGSDEYQARLESLKTLTEIECDKMQAKPKRNYGDIIKPVVVGAVGTIQLFLIMGYEQYNLLPKKALEFVLRGRV